MVKSGYTFIETNLPHKGAGYEDFISPGAREGHPY